MLPRPSSLLVVAVAAVALALSGCTGSTTDTSDGGEGSGAGSPVVVEHRFGSTTVPRAPERVAAVGFGDQDVLLALDIVPVAAVRFLPDWDNGVGPWAEDLLDGAEPLAVDGLEPDLEAIAAQRPDLIVAVNSGLDEQLYDQLSRIAPTVASPPDVEPYSIPWQTHTELVGAAVGRQQEAREIVSDIEADVAAAAADHPEYRGRSAQVVTALASVGGVRTYNSASRGYVLEALGFDVPAWVDEESGDGFYVELGQENVSRAEADVVVFLGTQAELDAQPLLSQLPAAKRGALVRPDADTAVAFATPGPLTVPLILDALLSDLEDVPLD